MNSRAINKIRLKFITVAMASFITVMLAMGGIIYTTNFLITRGTISEIMDMIIENDGSLPLDEIPEQETETDAAEAEREDEEDHMPRHLFTLQEIFGTANSIYNTVDNRNAMRYFAVLFNEDGSLDEVLTSRIAAIGYDEAEAYAKVAMKRAVSFGSFGNYYYKVADRADGGKIVVYLDCTTQILTNKRLLYTALSLIGLGMIITFMLVRMFSKKIVENEIRNAQTQKQFITNASHELKTPLAVIRANTEVEQMINGKNEWNQSTMRQVDRLTGLIQNLVMISRAEEKEDLGERDTIDISKIVEDTADTFAPVAAQDGKTLEKKIAGQVTLLADESHIRQLTTLLIDNAIKYCDDGGKITVGLSAKGKTAVLRVSNDYAEGKNTDYSRFFERFYRKDEAHSTDKGGYGIGLSIAEALVKQYRGTIDASWKDGVISFTCVLKN